MYNCTKLKKKHFMKKQILLLCMMFISASIFAQMTSKNGHTILPEEGDWAIQMNAVPLVNMALNAMDIMNDNGNNAAHPDYVTGFSNVIVGKYFHDANHATRLKISIETVSMSDKNFGAIVVIDNQKKVIGVFTERDVMNKVVGKELNPHKTLVKDIMTPNPRVANETDDLIDWLRIMSNERFRRLPVVDGNGHIKAVFTQGDFVSYTWPDLMYQIKNLATATLSKNFAVFLIIGGIFLYSLAMVFLIKTLV